MKHLATFMTCVVLAGAAQAQLSSGVGTPQQANIGVGVGQAGMWVGPVDPMSPVNLRNQVMAGTTFVGLRSAVGSEVRIRNAAGDGIFITDSGISANSDVDLTGNRLTGLADGVAATDGATVRQVDAVESKIDGLHGKINALESKLSGGIAIAAAMAQPVHFAPGATQAVTAGTALYGSAGAAAAQYNKLVVYKGKTVMLSAGGGISTDNQVLARAGASFSW